MNASVPTLGPQVGCSRYHACDFLQLLSHDRRGGEQIANHRPAQLGSAGFSGFQWVRARLSSGFAGQLGNGLESRWILIGVLVRAGAQVSLGAGLMRERSRTEFELDLDLGAGNVAGAGAGAGAVYMRRLGSARRGQTKGTSDGVLLVIVSSGWSRDMWVGRPPRLSMIQAVVSNVGHRGGSQYRTVLAQKEEVKWREREKAAMNGQE
ncbi:hypothetical protein J7T55_014638 [Diaporthe amygdali]|uniref:uncharacterized protein n=1 Tax=Phomopsis amygdali TaxID=1214568 RepID=UPI0022FE6655|nr:uncharacterized protein J7T55_014638 [Diaporthe amygdali]KAJ0107110.1 hypothetical protein J7T55_014638 [Diaporthe amygdali]